MLELDPIDLAAVELLASSRQAVEDEVNSKARAFHEQAQEADRTLTLQGQMGAEAVRLYNLFSRREDYFLPNLARTFNHDGTLARQAQKYAGHIVAARDFEITTDRAIEIAKDEITRRINERDMNESMRLHGYNDQVAYIRTNYTYVSPPLFQIEAEVVNSVPIAQQWRVESNIPCPDEHDTDKRSLRIRTLQEFKTPDGDRAITPVHQILSAEDGTNCTVLEWGSTGWSELEEKKMYLPLGFVVAAQRAVIASVPRRVSWKW